MPEALNQDKDKRLLKTQIEPELVNTPSNLLYQHPFSNHLEIHSRHNESPEDSHIKPRWNKRNDRAIQESPEGLVTLKTSTVDPILDTQYQTDQFQKQEYLPQFLILPSILTLKLVDLDLPYRPHLPFF